MALFMGFKDLHTIVFDLCLTRIIGVHWCTTFAHRVKHGFCGVLALLYTASREVSRHSALRKGNHPGDELRLPQGLGRWRIV